MAQGNQDHALTILPLQKNLFGVILSASKAQRQQPEKSFP